MTPVYPFILPVSHSIRQVWIRLFFISLLGMDKDFLFIKEMVISTGKSYFVPVE